VADEADGSGSLNLFDVGVESYGSVSARGVPELFAIKKKEKIQVTLNPELPFETEAAFPQALPMSSPTWYRLMFLSLWFLI
jgi:hypothetical protein